MPLVRRPSASDAPSAAAWRGKLTRPTAPGLASRLDATWLFTLRRCGRQGSAWHSRASRAQAMPSMPAHRPPHHAGWTLGDGCRQLALRAAQGLPQRARTGITLRRRARSAERPLQAGQHQRQARHGRRTPCGRRRPGALRRQPAAAPSGQRPFRWGPPALCPSHASAAPTPAHQDPGLGGGGGWLACCRRGSAPACWRWGPRKRSRPLALWHSTPCGPGPLLCARRWDPPCWAAGLRWPGQP